MSRNPAQIRGDIQRGVTGDKRAGFDPAAAPLETDAEAAGTPLGAEHLRPAPQVTPPGHAADSYADAMLSTGVSPKKGTTPLILVMVAFMSVLLFGALLAAILRG